MRPISPNIFALVVGLGLVACVGGDAETDNTGSDDDDGGTGGATAGSGGSATGGAGPTGGVGGSTTSGTGGSPSGGAAGTAAGGQATGGSPSGGSATTGGSSSGGTSTTGGTQSGGSSGGGGTGGMPCTNVRPTGTEWDEATCDQWATETSECSNAWMVNNNYCNESCGRCSSGTGGTGTGGTGTGGTATGGTATGGTGTGGMPVVIPDTCTEADRSVCNNQSGQHCGYTFEYWKDQGSGCLVNTSNGFSVEWSNVNNLLGRKGRRPGSRSQVVTYTADYQPDGSSYLCVYGWTRNPLVEYYIVDSWGSWRPPGGEVMATVTSDGGTYEIYRTQRVNQPSIEGTRTFYQYWSVRTAKRTEGIITVANHFNAWEQAGLSLGSLYEVSMTVEGYQSSGRADVQMIMR